MIISTIANNQTMLSKDIYDSPLILVILLYLSVSIIGLISSFLYYRINKRGKPILTFFVISTIALAISTLPLGKEIKEIEDVAKISNANIKKEASDKYGVEIVENPANKKGAGKIELNESPLKAKDAEGNRIQVLIELTDDQKSILLFSNGKELPLKRG